MAKKFKTRKKYRLTFINENTFNAVWTVKLSRLKVWILSVVTVAAVAALVIYVATATPLKALLPGYLKPQQRVEHINNSLRVDSLAEVLELQMAYLDNITAILGGTVEPDSVVPPAPLAAGDTLLGASAEERAFVEKWNARERYALSVLTPVAADAVAFHAPVGGTRGDSLISIGAVNTLRFMPARGAAVTAIASGTVTDTHFTDDREWVVSVQHPNGFMSVLSGISSVAVEPGRKVRSGDVLGRTAGAPLYLAVWLDGASLNPAELLR
ncbi:MAG: M23 family metallopeptidase [Muribaculaceae bacterium]|nr:M23 family metallopeptidase [Muribaculaceae bacterium]